MIIPESILRRTFQCFFGGLQGTCFTADYNNRQYIVTARHNVEGITDSTTIQIMHKQGWRDYSVDLVGHHENDIDISVLAAKQKLPDMSPVRLTTTGMILGQDVHLLGFPYQLGSDLGEFPLPLIKKGVFAGYVEGIHLLDGYVTSGFSGGPVVFFPGEDQDKDCSICAVISGYRHEKLAVFDGDERSHLRVKSNAGIVVCYDIRYAVDLIRQNPIGFNLPQETAKRI